MHESDACYDGLLHADTLHSTAYMSYELYRCDPHTSLGQLSLILPYIDNLAEHWMALVLTPAIKDSGVYKPLETLQSMRSVNWEAVGVCRECRALKDSEWKEEAERIWAKLDEWLNIYS